MAASFGLTDVFSRTYTAGEALAAFDAVTLTASGTVIRVDSNTETVLGFANRACASGEEVAVRSVSAPSNNATSQSTVAVGALLFPSSTDGQLSTTGTPGTHAVVGIALTAASGGAETIVIVPVASA